MDIIQVPAAKSQWGLTKFPYGVPGRLGNKVQFIVIHWMDTDLAGADSVFTGKTSRQVSAHFGVENTIIHQYVSVGNTAWHSGSWSMNLKSVAIEHSAQPGRDASDATYDTSGQLIAMLWRQLGMSPDRSTLIPHSSVVATACPGTIDIDRLYRIARGYYGGVPVQNVQVTVASAPIAPTNVVRRFAPFTTNLEPNQEYNAEVVRVQAFLQWQELMADPGQGKGYYGPKTQAAIDAFQKKQGITAGKGYFGWWYDKTRDAANKIVDNDANNQPISNA